MCFLIPKLLSWAIWQLSWVVLEWSWRVLGQSGGLGAVLGILGPSGANMLIFHWFYNGLAAQVPGTAANNTASRTRGVSRGRHKSLPQELRLEDLDLGLLAWCSVQVLYTP